MGPVAESTDSMLITFTHVSISGVAIFEYYIVVIFNVYIFNWLSSCFSVTICIVPTLYQNQLGLAKVVIHLSSNIQLWKNQSSSVMGLAKLFGRKLRRTDLESNTLVNII